MPTETITSPIIEQPAKRKLYSRISLVLRRIHMFVALFLKPWIAMYALSTIVFNHWQHVSKLYGGEMERFEKEKEIPYNRNFPAGASAITIGEQIAADLGVPEK